MAWLADYYGDDFEDYAKDCRSVGLDPDAISKFQYLCELIDHLQHCAILLRAPAEIAKLIEDLQIGVYCHYLDLGRLPDDRD